MLSKPALAVGLAVVAGYLVGFLWGRGTRDALPGSTSTEFSGGVLTVRVDASRAAQQGLSALLG
jgi:hypothetical protein